MDSKKDTISNLYMSYEDKTRNSLNMDLRTLRQWAIAGYTPKDGCVGKEMYPNGFRQKRYTYYSPQDVRPMTDAERAAFTEKERSKQREARRRLKAKQKQKLEQIRKIREWIKTIRERKNAVHEIVSHSQASSRPHESLDLIVVDIETSGLNPVLDEVLQVSILSGAGAVLYHNYIRPLYSQSWPDAQAINGITPEMVSNAPLAAEEMPKIAEILTAAKVIVGYNIGFDLNFLSSYGVMVKDCYVIDVMEEFAQIDGEDCRWQALSTCANYFGYDWGDSTAHDSLADCRATLFCYQKLTKGSLS